MSKEEQKEELEKEAEKTFDESKKTELKDALISEKHAEETLTQQARELADKQKKKVQQQQQLQSGQKPMPQWLSPENKAILNLVGFDSRKFNEKNFIQTLARMGITKVTIKGHVVYQVNSAPNRFVQMNAQRGQILMNNGSGQAFKDAARLASASGATALDMSQFIKQQEQAKNPNLDKMLTDAYKAAKNEGLTLAGMEGKPDLMRKLEGKIPMAGEAPKPKD